LSNAQHHSTQEKGKGGREKREKREKEKRKEKQKTNRGYIVLASLFFIFFFPATLSLFSSPIFNSAVNPGLPVESHSHLD